MATEKCKQELRDAIGSQKVRDDDISLTVYASDFFPGLFRKPDIVVFPESAEDVRKVMPIANKYRIPVTVLSGGVNVVALTVPVEHGILLDMRRMDRIIEINTDSGYALVEPGVTFEEFSNALNKVGYRCHITTAPPSASVVANYLMRTSGTFVTRHLDPMIDLEVVFPDGSITTTGSSHFPGAGSHLRYGAGPDITGIFCLAHGTMGIVTKAAVRIYPKPETDALPLATFNSYEDSVNYMKDVAANNIAEHVIVYSWRMWLDNYEKGATDFKKPPKGLPYNAVSARLAGPKEIVAATREALKKYAAKHNGTLLTDKEAADIFLIYPGMQEWYFHSKTVQMNPFFLKKTLATYKPEVRVDDMGLYVAWIVMAPPKSIIEVEKFAMQRIQDIGAGVPAYYSQPFDFGRSIFLRCFIYPDLRDKEMMGKVMQTFAGMYGEALDRYGATPFRARGFGPVPWLHNTGEFQTLLKKIKGAVDPNNILNPHMLG